MKLLFYCAWLLAAPPPDAPPMTPEAARELFRSLGTKETASPAESERDRAQFAAKVFFVGLAQRRLDVMQLMITGPTYIEGHLYGSTDEARLAWAQLMAAREGESYQLNSLDVLTPEQMETKYGKPPARLSSWPWKGPKTYIAVGNFSGRATLLLLKWQGKGWSVAAFSD